MYDYWLRVADKGGRMRDLASFLAGDDAQALAQAQRLCEGRSFQLTRAGKTIAQGQESPGRPQA
ncbi:MAG: hypothetical protein ACHP9T_05375 [Caulobacterales bacterium]|jgi:predicted dinucleotide-binding enzyme